MREIRPSGSEGGGAEINRLSLPLSSFFPNPLFTKHRSLDHLAAPTEILGADLSFLYFAQPGLTYFPWSCAFAAQRSVA